MKRLIILLSSILVSSLFGASIVKDFHFSENDLRIERVDGYDLLEMRDFIYPTEESKPLIPFYSVSFLIPSTAEIKNVTIIDSEKIEIPGEYLIYPTQRPRAIFQEKPETFVMPNESIYSLANEYPEERVETIRSGCKSGYRIAGLLLYPISYIPKEKKIFLYTRIKLSIEYEEGVYEPPYLTPSQKALFSQDVKNLVINPEDINRFSPLIRQTANPEVDYIIITNTSLKNKFLPLVNWLRKTGLWADTISTSRISSNYTGRDLPEKIRNFIKDYFNTQGLKYVLLGGSNSIIPKRGCYAQISTNPPTTDSFIPCDLYFADLDYSWDGNQNNIFGDTFTISGLTDTVDLYSDLYVGRWPVQWAATAAVDTMIRKLMTYTKNPDTLYQKRALLVGAFLWNGYNHMQSQDSISNLSPGDWIDQVINQGTNDGLRYQVRDSLNNGFGFCHLVAHGNDEATWIYTKPQYHRNDPPTQTNYNKLAIVNSIACYPGNFEYSNCLAEAMMKASGSAVDVIMNSRYGWGQPPSLGPSEKLDIRFYHYFFSYDSIRIAHCHQASKECYRNTALYNQTWRWCYYELNLFGEPSMMIWKDNPKIMLATFPNPIFPGIQTFPVTVTSVDSPVSKALVVLWKGTEVYVKGLTDANGQVNLTINPNPGYMYVTVTAKNKLPFEDSCQIISLTKDVGLTQIIAPTGTIDSDTIVTPQAKVKNFGTDSVAFPVIFRISPSYSDTQNIDNLASGDSIVVSFVPWTALVGIHTTKCTTALAGDQNPSNDAISDSVIVAPVQMITEKQVGEPGIGKFIFSVTPNPADNVIVVKYSPRNEPAHFELYDIHGRIVKSGPMRDSPLLIETKNLPAGAYVLILRINNSVRRKLVIIRR